jgi:hypothetical protein
MLIRSMGDRTMAMDMARVDVMIGKVRIAILISDLASKNLRYYKYILLPPIQNKCRGFSSFLVKFEINPQHLLWIRGSS